MLTYGGLGLLIAGIVFMFFSDKINKDPEKAAKTKKQAPILMLVGAAFLGAAFVIGGALA